MNGLLHSCHFALCPFNFENAHKPRSDRTAFHFETRNASAVSKSHVIYTVNLPSCYQTPVVGDMMQWLQWTMVTV